MKNKLTDAEKELMEILWTNKTAFMKDLLQALPEPKPAATTVATNLKRMQNKDLIGYKSFGNSRQYIYLLHERRCGADTDGVNFTA